MNFFINHLVRAWHGPPIQVIFGGRTIRLGSGTPQARVTIKHPRVWRRLAWASSLAFGEGYMNGDIEIEGDLLAVMQGYMQTPAPLPLLAQLATAVSRLPISRAQATRNARHHYDIGNEFYALWLDPSRTYSCAYFPDGDESLEVAQFKKRELICQKLQLKPNQTLLDIGCGWGSLLFHAAEHYGVIATGITPAQEQVAHIRAEIKRRGLTGRVKILTGDWRSLTGTYDRLVSVGMFEHVGRQQYGAFFRQWSALLAPDGISLLHTIARRTQGPHNAWMSRYIFPGGYLPTLSEIAAQLGPANLWLYRTHNLKPHYAKTLAAWSANFQRHRAEIVSMFDEQFARMWWLYLQGSEAGFRWGELELLQLELYGSRAALPAKQPPSL